MSQFKWWKYWVDSTSRALDERFFHYKRFDHELDFCLVSNSLFRADLWYWPGNCTGEGKLTKDIGEAQKFKCLGCNIIVFDKNRMKRVLRFPPSNQVPYPIQVPLVIQGSKIPCLVAQYYIWSPKTVLIVKWVSDTPEFDQPYQQTETK